MQLLILGILSFLISIVTTFLIKQYLSQKLVDIPNDRSSHSQPTPRGGGLGFILGFAVTSLIVAIIQVYLPEISSIDFKINILYLWLILTPLAVIGIIDDRYNVPAKIRYLVQLIVTIVAVISFGNFPLPWLTNLGIYGQIITIILTIIGFTALINFYNFMDGLDGIVASVSAIQLAFIAFYFNQPLWWFLVAGLIGFLYWNWSPAKIFMGDVGSTFLGATIAIAILNTQDHPIMAWSGLAITLSLTADAIYTLICRLIRRENIFQAHRTHLYQRLQQSGCSHAQVSIIYCLVTIANSILIINFHSLGSWLSLLLVTSAIAIGELYLHFLIRK